MDHSREQIYKFRIVISTALLLLVFIIAWFTLIASPKDFYTGSLFSIDSGATLDEISKGLFEGGYIKSPFVFKAIVRGIFFSGKNAAAGDYVFEKRLNAIEIASRIVRGKYNLVPIKVTIPEGLTKFETAEILDNSLLSFDKDTFLDMAPEGYLFPDTYFFTPNASPNNILKVMSMNFDRQIEKIEGEIERYGRPLDQVVIMASILETEARLTETRKIIAGILWNRLDKGMPLQVDVSWKYINGKNTYELTDEDLAIDSPYNTYKYAGLPPTAIASPGLDSLLAAVSPIKTDYVYFLSDRGGGMHYAITFEEHKENKRKYLHFP